MSYYINYIKPIFIIISNTSWWSSITFIPYALGQKNHLFNFPFFEPIHGKYLSCYIVYHDKDELIWVNYPLWCLLYIYWNSQINFLMMNKKFFYHNYNNLINYFINKEKGVIKIKIKGYLSHPIKSLLTHYKHLKTLIPLFLSFLSHTFWGVHKP